jgi:hypothetical protein
MREGDFTKIKEALNHNRKLATEGYRGNAIPGGKFDKIIKERKWPLYDSTLENFGTQLSPTLPKDYQPKKINEGGKRFEAYVKSILSPEKKGDLYAIEFGGPGSKLFQDFNGFFSKTVGVCLEDIRSTLDVMLDKLNNHFVLEGDIMDVTNDTTLTRVTKQLDGHKADLIISRMAGPLNSIKKHPAILDRIIRNWYRMLNENGLMFVQVANHYDKIPFLKDWVERVKNSCPEIDLQEENKVIRLHKRKGAPEELPPASQLFKEEANSH